jgi:hypothetical protein
MFLKISKIRIVNNDTTRGDTNMKTIENAFNQARPLPAIFAGIAIGNEPENVANPFSGDTVLLQPDAVAVYDVIKGAEVVGEYAAVRAGLDWFRKYFPEEYMMLLD